LPITPRLNDGSERFEVPHGGKAVSRVSLGAAIWMRRGRDSGQRPVSLQIKRKIRQI
jgi:hypothetical protein